MHDRTRKQTKKDRLFPEIEQQLVTAPLVTLAEQYRILCETHPHDHLCEQTFRDDVNEMAVTKILHRIPHLGFHQEQTRDVTRYLQEVVALDRGRHAKHAEIVETFPEVQKTSGMPKAVWGDAARSSSCWGGENEYALLAVCDL